MKDVDRLPPPVAGLCGPVSFAVWMCASISLSTKILHRRQAALRPFGDEMLPPGTSVSFKLFLAVPPYVELPEWQAAEQPHDLRPQQ